MLPKSVFSLLLPCVAFAAPSWTTIGTRSTPAKSEVRLELSARFQAMRASPGNERDHYEVDINSPKSANFSPDGAKLYVESLEGGQTVVMDVASWTRVKSIEHEFGPEQAGLFAGTEVFDYSFGARENVNIFRGKPVESAFSHGGKYLWVTYYRRSFDSQATLPSAVAVIDTRSDSIIRVIPTGPLPKMIAASPDGNWMAITHWGDNTVTVLDIHAAVPDSFRYVAHLVLGGRMKFDFQAGEHIDRDNNCGNCLRGTIFTPDSKNLLVGRMGGSGGISVFDTKTWETLGNATGMRENVRHLAIHSGNLLLSANQPGVVQKIGLDTFMAQVRASPPSESIPVKGFASVSVGAGARTIAVDSSGQYLFACINGKSQIKVVRISDMRIVASMEADSYPVGMAISPDGLWLAVTAQGHAVDGGGNSVMIYKITKSGS